MLPTGDAALRFKSCESAHVPRWPPKLPSESQALPKMFRRSPRKRPGMKAYAILPSCSPTASAALSVAGRGGARQAVCVAAAPLCYVLREASCDQARCLRFDQAFQLFAWKPRSWHVEVRTSRSLLASMLVSYASILPEILLLPCRWTLPRAFAR
eukprot:2241059-Pleurochrysis_carterae.AAC.2